MKRPALLALILAGVPVIGGDMAVAQRRTDQVQAFDGRRQGRLTSLREIEKRVVPGMKAEYLGADFDADSMVYTLKFLRNGNVIWVDVDGRSGQVLGQTGR